VVKMRRLSSSALALAGGIRTWLRRHDAASIDVRKPLDHARGACQDSSHGPRS
jgi:hypothetical protein